MRRNDKNRARHALPSAGLLLAMVFLMLGMAPVDSVRGQTPAPPASSAPEAGPSSEEGSDYVIGPGDTVQVFVWRNPELSVSVPVRPDGKISTPLVEDMTAVGKTPSQLARDIERVLAEYVRSPQVNIIVTNAMSAFNQVKIIGQVRNPQSVAYREGMTVMDVVLAAGGLTEFAAGNRARLLRKDEKGNEKPTRLRLDDLMRKGRAVDNPPMKPGDVIVVPEAMF
jgi:polysaccharide biosynthesis/export protein